VVKLASFTAEEYLDMFLKANSAHFNSLINCLLFLLLLTNNSRDQIKLAEYCIVQFGSTGPSVQHPNRKVLNQIQDSYCNRQHECIFTSKLEHSIKKKNRSSLLPLVANNVAPAKWTQK